MDQNRTFYLKGDTYGYDKNDFRDPFLFQTEDGVYHMLIATRKNGKGHIAEFTSADLKEWESAGTFMTMMWIVSTNVRMYSRWGTGGI